MATASTGTKRPAPMAPRFVPFQHSQSLETEASETLDEMIGVFDLTVHLPDDSTTVISVDPSTPMIDLQINICAQLKLNPTDHTLQVFPPDGSQSISYKANHTIESVGVNNTVKLVKRRTDKDKQRQIILQPFENTQRVIITLPNSQKYVMRVRPDILLSELFKVATRHKDLDPCRYQLCHPTNHKVVLNMDCPLNFYGLSEIYLAYIGVNQINGATNLNSVHLESELQSHELSTAFLSNTISRESEAASGNESNVVSGQRRRKNATDTMSKSSEFLVGTNFEKKKGLFSFLRRKKSGKFSFGGSMQNLHQVDGPSIPSTPEQSREYPIMSDLQAHRKSLPTSSIKTNSSKDVSADAVILRPLSMAPVVMGHKKRPAPLPPTHLLPVQSEAGSDRVIQTFPPPIQDNSQTLIKSNEERISGKSSENISVSPEIEKSADVSARNASTGRHSPVSSGSSGFEEMSQMSPSPSDDCKNPDLSSDCHSTVNIPSDFEVIEGGLIADSSEATPRPPPRTKRKAPPPPTGFGVASGTSEPRENSSSVNSPSSEPRPGEMFSGIEKDQIITVKDDSVCGLFPEAAAGEAMDAAAAAAEDDDCFCEMDAGYDGEIDFDNVSIVFVTPDTTKPGKLSIETAGKLGLDNTAKGDGHSMSVNVSHQLKDIQSVLALDGQMLSNEKTLTVDHSEKIAVEKLSAVGQTSVEEPETPDMMRRNANNSSAGVPPLFEIHSRATASCVGSVIDDVSEELYSGFVMPPNEFRDHFADSSSSVDIDLQNSEKILESNEVKLCGDQQAVIIDEPELLPERSLPIIAEFDDIIRNSLLKQDHLKDNELHSDETCSREESLCPEDLVVTSDDSRRKLLNVSFQTEQSACQGFCISEAHSEYASEIKSTVGKLPTSVVCGNTDDSTFQNNRTTREGIQNCKEENSTTETNFGVTSLRDLKPKPVYVKKSNYELIKHPNGSRTILNNTNTDANSDVCKIDAQVGPKGNRLPEPRSSGETFKGELLKRLSQWQQLHGNNSDGIPPQPSVLNSNFHGAPDIKNASLSKVVAKQDLTKGGKILPDSTDQHKSGVGSTDASGRSVLTSAEPASKLDAGMNSGTKQFNSSDVVLTMDQLLTARSGLKKTTATDQLPNVKNTGSLMKSDSGKNSSKPTDRASGVSATPPSVCSIPKPAPPAPPASRNAPPLPPNLVVSKKERKSDNAQRVAPKTSSRPSEQANQHDQLLAAIRNAGGKPVKCKSSVLQ